MPERRADPRRRRLHRGDARDDPHLEAAPACIARFDRLEHRRGHGEDAGIAAGNDSDATPGRGQRERLARTRQLLAVVARMPKLARPLGQPRQIRAVADEIARRGERLRRFRRHPFGSARAEPDNAEPPLPAAHGRLPSPGTRMRAK